MRLANEEWDTEFAAALLETTQDAQAPHFQRCSEIFNDELPYIPIYQRVDYAIVSDNLQGPGEVRRSCTRRRAASSTGSGTIEA